jgi:hypothetical protein
MSVWRDMHQRSNGLRERKEDIEEVYFRLNALNTFELDENVIFNKGTSCECVGKYITQSRISFQPLFKLVKGNKTDVNNDVYYDDRNGARHYTSVTFIYPFRI